MKKIIRIIIVGTFACVLAGCVHSIKRSSSSLTVESVLENYARFPKATPNPVYVSPHLARLCRGAMEADVEGEEEKHGPHAHSAITVYMNEEALVAFRSDAAYPEGAVIVKEKSHLPFFRTSTSNPAKMESVSREDGVGGMIKRAAGSFPESGNWEFFYSTPSKRIESGAITSCVTCHETAQSKDWVFADWAKGL